MLDIPDAYERALDRRPFSNGTAFYAWIENWCGRCAHDGIGLGREDPACPLIPVALNYRTPAEWLDQTPAGEIPALGDQFHCVMFRDRDDPGGSEPGPVPDPPAAVLAGSRA